LLTMMQVEKSHIPYPDEPPVHFPPSKVWKDLLQLRKRYATNDFEGDMHPSQRKRMEFLKSALDNPIPEIAAAEVGLPILLTILSDFASPPGAKEDPSRRVAILLDDAAFKRETMGMFDAEKVQIKFGAKLAGVSLATVLRLVCEQIDATYWIRRDYIEIVPAGMAIREKVIRVFPVEDLTVGIPNAVNTSALQQNLQVLGATFSLGGGGGGAPVVFNGNAGGGFNNQGGFFGGNNAGMNGGQNQAAGGLFAGGGVAGFGGGIQGSVGSNLGGQFGFQGQDYGPILIQLITEVVARGEWALNNNAVIGGGGMMGVDPPMDAQPLLPADQLNSLGYWPPARALIVRATSRIHRTNSSKLKPKDAAMPINFVPAGPRADAGNKNNPNAVAKVEPIDPKNKRDQSVVEIIKNEKNLDPEKIYQMVLNKGLTDPGEIIACVDFMVQCRQFKHATELLKASLRSGVVAEPWAQEALAVALEGSQGSAEEIERARLSSIDLAPKSPLAYLKASKAMADIGQPDRALEYCRVAARLEPNMPDPYINALVYAGDKKATLDSSISVFAAGNLLSHDWTSDTAEYHLRAREHLKEQAAKFTAQNKPEDARKVQALLDNEKRRDLVIQLLWSGEADLDLKVREAIGTTCSSIEKQTSGGGVLLCDEFTQKDDNRFETYTAAEAFNGSYTVTVDRV
ncbi:MAG: hypothetical protein K8T89_22600, partial [Planctomycetes bacterium]|nr:hypothetical protein [Planctomycetota bacterium]